MIRSQRGVAAFEFVLSLPVLIIGLFCLLYYGYALLLYRVGVDAAYIGAEAAVTVAPLDQDSGTGSNAARAAAAQALAGYAQQKTTTGIGMERRCMTPSAVLVAVGGGEYTYSVAIDFEACSVLAALSVELPFFGRLPPAPAARSVSATVRL